MRQMGNDEVCVFVELFWWMSGELGHLDIGVGLSRCLQNIPDLLALVEQHLNSLNKQILGSN